MVLELAEWLVTLLLRSKHYDGLVGTTMVAQQLALCPFAL